MNALIETLRRFGPMKLLALGAVAIGLLAFFTFAIERLTAQPMGLLFSELSAQDSGQIIARLDALAVPYELRGGGSQIYVPQDQALRLRMSFAEQGMPKGGSVGYEIFDRSDTLGASNLVHNLNLMRALEGELARTIGSLGPVSGARVHVVMAKRDLFSRDRQDPTASVVVKLRSAGGLERSQVQAIQQLVAAAVAGLKPNRVSVIDDRGTLLARGQGDGDDANDSAAAADDMRRGYEQRLARTVETLLERTLGVGKVRAEVNVDMDFDRIVTQSETYDPDGQVVRSTQTNNETSDTTEANGGAVSVTTNLPDADQANAPKNASRTNKTEETVNYEISRTTKNHVREAGVVRRLSVAVLVDGTTTVADNGQRSYEPRSAEQMTQLTALVRNAVGFNQQRGDTVEVTNLAFAAAEVPPVEVSSSMFDLGLTKQDYFWMAQTAVLGIVGILVVLLVARPLVNNLFKPTEALAAAGGAGAPQLADQTGGPRQALPPPAGGPAGPEGGIDISQIEGRVQASSIKKVGEIVDKHPDEAVSIMRSWMYQEN